mgnify:CR=1 FL=1
MDIKKKKTLLIAGSIFAVLLIILTIILLLTSNKNNPNDDGDSSTNTGGNVTLIYWGLWEPEEVMHPLIEKYEAENPGVKIEYAQQTFKNYESRLYTRLEQSTNSAEPAPDIFRINNTWLPKYQKFLSSLPTNIMDNTTYAQEFYPTATADFTGIDGKIYAIPIEIDGLTIIYNKQILSKAGYTQPPQDWDSFIEAANKMTKRDSTGKISISGLAIGTAKNVTHSADILTFLMLQNGAQIIDSTKTQVNITSQRAISALDKYTEFATSTEPLWATYLPQDLTLFYEGKLAMMFAPSWRAFDIINSAPQIEFGIASLPQLPNNQEINYSMYWGDTVSKTSKNQAVAWDFINFLSEPEQQRRLFSNSSQIRAFGEPYSRVSMNSELASNPYTQAIAKMAPTMTSWQIGEQGYIEELFREAITSIVEDGKNSTSILKSIQTDINDQLAKSNR